MPSPSSVSDGLTMNGTRQEVTAAQPEKGCPNKGKVPARPAAGSGDMPARWGGRDADPWIAFILAEEMWMAGEPRGGQLAVVSGASEVHLAGIDPEAARGHEGIDIGAVRDHVDADRVSLLRLCERRRLRA